MTTSSGDNDGPLELVVLPDPVLPIPPLVLKEVQNPLCKGRLVWIDCVDSGYCLYGSPGPPSKALMEIKAVLTE